MQNNDYLIPGLATIVLAIVFPLYWLSEVPFGVADLTDALWQNLRELNFSDAVFLLMGILSIYIYYSLKKILNEQLNYKSIDVLLMIMIGVNILSVVGLLGLDLTATVLSEESVVANKNTILGLGAAINIATLIIFGLLDILLGAVLLMGTVKVPTLLKIFALVTLIQGLFEITVIFVFSVIFIFPVALIILACYFLRKPEMLEVV